MKKSIKIGLGAFFLVLVAGAAIYFGNPQLLRGAVVAMPSFNLKVRGEVTPETGGLFRLKIFVRNTGTIPIPPFKYLDFENDFAGNLQTYLGMLAPGQEIKLLEKFSRKYYYLLLVDPNNALSESNEKDNAFMFLND